METKQLYTEARNLRCFAGDTLPVFVILTDADDLTGCTMSLVAEDLRTPGSASLTKSCTRYDDEPTGKSGFSVQLVSSDTAQLSGHYRLHFVMTDSDGTSYRKLVCGLEVLPVPEV